MGSNPTGPTVCESGWNWHTRRIQNPLPSKGVWVRIPPLALLFRLCYTISTHMETIATIFFIVSAISALAASQIKLYTWAYSQGYGHGKHAGFSEGLFKAYERKSRMKEKLYHDATI